jgi:hypothetical protein
MKPRTGRVQVRIAVIAATCALGLGGCEVLLGVGDLTDRPGDAAADAAHPTSEGGAYDATTHDGATDAGATEAAPADGADAPADGSTPTCPNPLDGAVSLDGCILLLHMDETSWSQPGSVKDCSGLGNDGTTVGNNIRPVPDAGRFGGAGQFGGFSYIDVPDNPSLHPTGGLTCAAWIYPTGLTDGTPFPGIISKRSDFGLNVAFTMFLWTNNDLYADLPLRVSSDASAFVNYTWYHVAVVFDGTQQPQASMYINGAFVVSGPSQDMGPTLPDSDADLTVGNLSILDKTIAGPYFLGLIDEVAVWKRALSAAEIRSLYQATGPL